jgi:hypothetical protein
VGEYREGPGMDGNLERPTQDEPLRGARPCRRGASRSPRQGPTAPLPRRSPSRRRPDSRRGRRTWWWRGTRMERPRPRDARDPPSLRQPAIGPQETTFRLRLVGSVCGLVASVARIVVPRAKFFPRAGLKRTISLPACLPLSPRAPTLLLSSGVPSAPRHPPARTGLARAPSGHHPAHARASKPRTARRENGHSRPGRRGRRLGGTRRLPPRLAAR